MEDFAKFCVAVTGLMFIVVSLLASLAVPVAVVYLLIKLANHL